MLRYMKTLEDYSIHAVDGEIGSVEDFYFDDERWVVRYLVANTGGWLSGRLVLISPISVEKVNWVDRMVHVNLTKEQVERSPDIDLRKPVSRQEETRLHAYYTWPVYWGGIGMWGGGMYPAALATETIDEDVRRRLEEQKPDRDTHLRSAREVTGYHIQTRDDGIGHLEDFAVEDGTWALRYFIVDTRNWLPGKKVILSVRWIEKVVWEEAKVHVDLTKEGVKNAPEFNPHSPIERTYETRLHEYYDRPPYW